MGWKQRVLEWMLVRQRSCNVGWADFRVRILESIHAVFAGSCEQLNPMCRSVRWVHKRCSGIQESWRVILISIAGEFGGWEWPLQSVLLKEVVIEPNVKLECVTKFCYLGDTLGAARREEVRRRRQEPEWDVLGLSSRSYFLSWQLGVHHTA